MKLFVAGINLSLLIYSDLSANATIFEGSGGSSKGNQGWGGGVGAGSLLEDG